MPRQGWERLLSAGAGVGTKLRAGKRRGCAAGGFAARRGDVLRLHGSRLGTAANCEWGGAIVVPETLCRFFFCDFFLGGDWFF